MYSPADMKKSLVVALSVVAASAFAGSNPGDSNWSVRLGPIFPRVNNGVDTKVGVSFGVSYRAFKGDQFAVEVEALGSAYKADAGGGDVDITVSNLNVLVLAEMPNQPFYLGGLIGATKATASSGGFSVSGDTKGVYGPVLGYQFNKQWSVEARYLFSDIPASRGTQVLAGYRF